MNRSPWLNFQYWPHLITLTIILLAFAAYRYFAYYFTYSNDAYVSANVINMAAIVSGPISEIYVNENQKVEKGQKLIQIDPRPYKYTMDKAQSDLKIAELNYENQKYAVTAASEQLTQSKDFLSLSKEQLLRYQQSEQKGKAALNQLIDLEAKIKEQEAAVIASMQKLKIAELNVDINKILAAKANYEKAQYMYEHTTLLSPTEGYISNFNLTRGQYVQTGEGLFALIDNKKWWVVTRYRETAIRLIKPGYKAKIRLDMYPGKLFYGHVQSVGWGINRVQSGKVAPSTLIYEEPSEDWIKIAQRFPVRIDFDELSADYPLRIGASARTYVYH